MNKLYNILQLQNISTHKTVKQLIFYSEIYSICISVLKDCSSEKFKHWIIQRGSGLMYFINFKTFSNIYLFIIAFNTEK
jgi:hypothetical protein